MENKFILEVNNTLQGQLKSAYQIPQVENAFATGSKCEQLYSQVYDAERRLEQRLGVHGYDKDVEAIIDALLEIQEELCCRMYCYGAKFGMRE